MSQRSVLILDDDQNLGEMLVDFLRTIHHCDVVYLYYEEDLWPILDRRTFDLFLLDYKLADTTGLAVLKSLNARGIFIPTVLMTGEGSENIAAQAIQLGAIDYLKKGEYPLDILPRLIEKAVSHRQSQAAVQQARQQIDYHATLLSNVQDAVIGWDTTGKITYWNESAEQLFNHTAAEMLSSPVESYFKLFAPGSVSDHHSPNTESISERLLTASDGASVWLSSKISPLVAPEDSGQVIGYLDVVRDITASKQEQEALINTKHFTESILATLPGIVYIYNLPHQRLVYISPKVEQVLGYSLPEILNLSTQDLQTNVHPDDLPQLLDLYRSRRLKQGRDSWLAEYRALKKDGSWTWLANRESVFSWDEDHHPLEIIGFCSDINRQKLMELEIVDRLKSEELILSISDRFLITTIDRSRTDILYSLEMVQDFIKSDQAAFILVEHGSIDMFVHTGPPEAPTMLLSDEIKLTASQLEAVFNKLKINESILITDLPKLPQHKKELFQPWLQEKNIISLVLTPVVVNRDFFGMLVFTTGSRVLPWKKDYNYLLRSFSTILMKTLQKLEADKALYNSEAKYRAIVEDHQTEVICRLIPDGSLTFVNERFSHYFPALRENAIGESLLDFIAQEDRGRVRDALDSLSPAQPVAIVSHRTRSPRKKPVWLEWVFRIISNDPVGNNEIQAVGRDITDRKQMEEQINTVQTRLAQSARFASIGQLASSVAHQISNPLTTILADAQLLSQDVSQDHPQHESAQAILDAGRRVQQVVDELMKFSQPPPRSRQLVEINATINKAILLVGSHLSSNQIKLNLALSDSALYIEGFVQQLTDLWVNLLLAASSQNHDSIPANIWVESKAGSIEGEITVLVSDDGPQIPPDQYESIFEPQLIPAGEGRGTGIELSLCREIVRQHSGSIRVQSDPERTTFLIIFAGMKNNESNTYFSN